MAKGKRIGHEGIVKSVSGQSIEIMIVSMSACSACHAKSACSMSDMQQKMITAIRPDFDIATGDKVMVYAAMNNAIFSVIMAYVIPSVILVGFIPILLYSGLSETSAAAGALGGMAVYFSGLYLSRKRIGKKIRFTVERC